MIDMKPQVRPSLKRASMLDEIVHTIVFVLVVTVLFDMAIPRSLVDGNSMLPNFHNGERLIVSRIHYLLAPPQRGDVIVLNSVESDLMLIKRVVGVPGDTIEFRDHQLYLNGSHVTEAYTMELDCVSNCQDRTWELAADEYFVMGDNRNHSHDSRSFDEIPIDHIVGRVLFRYWPVTDIKWIRRLEPEFAP